jgi:hypothetical protein
MGGTKVPLHNPSFEERMTLPLREGRKKAKTR